MKTKERVRLWGNEDYCNWRGITPNAAAQERRRHSGPPFIKLRSRVYYDPLDVYQWVDENKVR